MPTAYVLSKTKKIKKYQNVSSDNHHFYIREKSLYIDCMGGFSDWSHFSVKSRAFCTVSIKTRRDVPVGAPLDLSTPYRIAS